MGSEHQRQPTVDAPWVPSPMVAYRCNLQGCCCGDWGIHFTDEDLVRMARHLPPERLGRGLVCVVDRDVVDHFEYVFEPGADGYRWCRFLGPDRTCTIQRDHGVAALPGICVDFPVHAYRLDGRVEFGFDTLCPGVLDALFLGDEPVVPVRMTDLDEMYQRRLERVTDCDGLTLDTRPADQHGLRLMRDRLLDALRDTHGAVTDNLRKVGYGLARVIETARPEDFDPSGPAPEAPFVRYLTLATSTHSGAYLATNLERYARFVMDPELAALAREGGDNLSEALDHWPEGLLTYVDPVEEAFRPAINRFLGVRYFSGLSRFRGEATLALARVPQVYATALRYACGLTMALARRADREVWKVALGAASFMYHNDVLPASAAVWFVPGHFLSDEPPERLVRGPGE